MASRMTDPSDALASFQQSYAHGAIAPQAGELHTDILVLADQPQGVSRLTYALVKNGHVVALAIFATADPIDGSPCFNAGYAVEACNRSRGFGKEVVQKAFEELSNGFKRARLPHLYIEAIVSTRNEHSNKLARRLFSPTAKPCTDGVSGEPALQYVKQLF